GPGLGGGIVGWLNTRQFRETHDGVASQGWTPIVVDTNGNGKRDAYVGPKDPLDPTKDKRVVASFYGVMPSPVDESIWCQSMRPGFSRIDQPGYIIRLVRGADPSNTALAKSISRRKARLVRAASMSGLMAWCGPRFRAVTLRASIASYARDH